MLLVFLCGYLKNRIEEKSHRRKIGEKKTEPKPKLPLPVYKYNVDDRFSYCLSCTYVHILKYDSHMFLILCCSSSLIKIALPAIEPHFLIVLALEHFFQIQT